MRASLVRIGNSRGLRLPKAVLEQCGFGGEVELRVEGRRLIILPIAAARTGWEEAFVAAGSNQELMLPEFGSEFDETEWTW